MQHRMHAATRPLHGGRAIPRVHVQCAKSRKLLVRSAQPETLGARPVETHPAPADVHGMSQEGGMGHASHQGNHGPVFDDHGGTYSRMGGGAASHISSNPAACPFLSNLPVPPKATAPWTAKHLQVTNPLKWLEITAKGREVVQGAFMLQPNITATTPGHARTVLSGEGQYTTLGWPAYFNELIGPGSLSTSVGRHHEMLRGLLQPLFSAEALAGSLPVVVGTVERYLATWAAAEGVVPGSDQIKLMTFAIILQVVVGPHYTQQQTEELSALFKTWLGGLFTVPTWKLPFLPYGAAMKARRELGKHIQEAIARERQREAAGLAPQGVLGKLLTAVDENGNRLTDTEVESNVINLLFAGHDTSSSTLAMIMCHLTTHPHVMERLRQEQQQVVAKYGPAITPSALKAMPYAEAVIRETLRLNSTVGGMMRRATTDFQLGPWRIPSGSSLFVSLAYMARHDPRWTAPKDVPAEVAEQHSWGPWPREEFNPDLLLTEEGKKPGWLMPFGYGNRYCIGAPLALLEMKTVLALLARHYKAAVVPLPTDWGMVPMPTPKNGLPLLVAPLGPARG